MHLAVETMNALSTVLKAARLLTVILEPVSVLLWLMQERWPRKK
uniref:Uncharacterized protein n=1 Tax=Brassica campestris TaxID=3711 RepID=A0A3P6AKZ2_BRACM|nr:unnamed protein product [Brassica rapa]